MSLTRIEVPHVMLELDTDSDILSYIGRELGRCALNENELVYCGLDGDGLEEVDDLPPRESTFAITYEDMRGYGEEYDRYKDCDSGMYPLAYARSSFTTPMILAYDKSLLVSADHKAPGLWLPRTGYSVSHAAKAMIIFS